MLKSHDGLRGLLDKHLIGIRDYPLDEIKKLDPDLHYQILEVSRERDKAVFRDDLNELLRTMRTVEELYLQAAEKHFTRVKR